MTINMRKCVPRLSGHLLRFAVCPLDISKDPEYVRMVESIIHPSSTKELQMILQIFNWCSRFVHEYANKVSLNTPYYVKDRSGNGWESMRAILPMLRKKSVEVFSLFPLISIRISGSSLTPRSSGQQKSLPRSRMTKT